MDTSLLAQSALICFASCSDDDIAAALHNRTDLRGRLHDLIASSFVDQTDAQQSSSASANWPDSHNPATPAPHAIFGGKQGSQGKGAGRQGTAQHGKGPSDYAPQSRSCPSWADMPHEPQASASGPDSLRSTTSGGRQATRIATHTESRGPQTARWHSTLTGTHKHRKVVATSKRARGRRSSPRAKQAPPTALN